MFASQQGWLLWCNKTALFYKMEGSNLMIHVKRKDCVTWSISLK